MRKSTSSRKNTRQSTLTRSGRVSTTDDTAVSLPIQKRHASSKSASARATEKSIAITSLSAKLPEIDTPVFFWRPHDPWGVLGQWYDSSFIDTATNQTFTCCEQYMMYHKALTFGDHAVAQEILDTSDPRMQKALGRTVTGFTQKKWEEVRFDIVVQANMLKFGGEAVVLPDDELVYASDEPVKGVGEVKLRQVLMSTGNRELVEASPRDRIWGIGFSPDRAAGVPRAKWGLNLLGKALMEVRRRLGEGAGAAEAGVAE